jgi:hypothetical protein
MILHDPTGYAVGMTWLAGVFGLLEGTSVERAVAVYGEVLPVWRALLMEMPTSAVAGLVAAWRRDEAEGDVGGGPFFTGAVDGMRLALGAVRARDATEALEEQWVHEAAVRGALAGIGFDVPVAPSAERSPPTPRAQEQQQQQQQQQQQPIEVTYSAWPAAKRARTVR